MIVVLVVVTFRYHDCLPARLSASKRSQSLHLNMCITLADLELPDLVQWLLFAQISWLLMGCCKLEMGLLVNSVWAVQGQTLRLAAERHSTTVMTKCKSSKAYVLIIILLEFQWVFFVFIISCGKHFDAVAPGIHKWWTKSVYEAKSFLLSEMSWSIYFCKLA